MNLEPFGFTSEHLRCSSGTPRTSSTGSSRIKYFPNLLAQVLIALVLVKYATRASLQSYWYSPTLTAPVHPCNRGISTSLYVIQRGNIPEPCFYAEEDYRRCLDDMQACTSKFDCRIHACTDDQSCPPTRDTNDGVRGLTNDAGIRSAICLLCE